MNEKTMQKRSDAEKLATRPTYAPPVDIFENNDELLILADVPGVGPEGLKINLDNDHLTIEAHRAQVAVNEESFDYKRTFVVPRGLESDKITANLANGVLRLTLPKPAALKPRQIEVKAG